MKTLLEDYKRKQKTIREMIEADDVTEETLKRLKVKQGMINSFIVDIHAAIGRISDEEATSSRRRKLLSFMNFLFENWQPRRHLTADMLVDAYLKDNNYKSDESEMVVCDCSVENFKPDWEKNECKNCGKIIEY